VAQTTILEQEKINGLGYRFGTNGRPYVHGGQGTIAKSKF